MNFPLVSVVIPNWNGARWLPLCLDSLRGQTFRDFEVLVVDNGSSDGSVGLLATHYPEVRVIPLPENKGFSGGVNVGIQASSGKYVAVLNNDLELHPRWLECTVQTLAEHPEAGFCAGKLLFYADRKTIDGAGMALDWRGQAYNLGHGEVDVGQFETPREVPGAGAAAVLYRRAMLDDIGLLDEDFFAYFEDVDLSFRAQLAGYRCRYAPDAVAYHVGSASPFRWPGLGVRNWLWVLLKNVPVGMLHRFQLLEALGGMFLAAWKEGELRSWFRGWWEALGKAPRMWRKRRAIQRQRRVSLAYLAALFDQAPIPRRSWREALRERFRRA